MNKNFELFKKECWYWIDKLELNNATYRFYDGLREEDKKKYNGAIIERNIENLQADIWFDNKDKNINTIKETAKHEIIHVLLFKLYFLGKSRQFTYGEYEREEEELVHKLEKIIK